jgi:ketosteroid isomerase-like protein
MKYLFLFAIALILSTEIAAQSIETIKNEVWQRELQYWQYVKNNDTAGYRTLWHDDFVGYPETEKLTGKDKIANWITEVHNAKERRFDFSLDRKMVNAFGDVVITFYDETDIWRNDKNEVVLEEVFKITHTWKKFGDTWLIIGGMSAVKRKQ